MYVGEILFGSSLHNYCLMIRGGKLSDIVNDWHDWRKYFRHASKHLDHDNTTADNNNNKPVIIADNIGAFVSSFIYLFDHQNQHHDDNLIKYDAREDIGRYGDNCRALHHTFYQGSCPSCFAFALASALGSRICLHSPFPETRSMIPSPYRIFDCSGNLCENSGIGLNTLGVMSVMNEGVPDIRESPSIFGWGCQKGRIKSNGVKLVCGIMWIKREIVLNGPVIMAVDMEKLQDELIQLDEWKEFYFFQGDFTRDVKKKSVRHALMILGWGVQPMQHWIVKNSWGAEWGHLGMGRVPWTRRDCALSFKPLIYADIV